MELPRKESKSFEVGREVIRLVVDSVFGHDALLDFTLVSPVSAISGTSF